MFGVDIRSVPDDLFLLPHRECLPKRNSVVPFGEDHIALFIFVRVMSLPQQDVRFPIRLRAVLSPGVRGCFSIFLSSSLNATQLCETCRGETDHAHSGRSPCRKRSKFRFNPNQAQLCTRLHIYMRALGICICLSLLCGCIAFSRGRRRAAVAAPYNTRE